MSAQGIDVSDFQFVQAVPTWKTYDFGFAKATEGTGWIGQTFGPNWANMKVAGIPRGAYHFFHPALDPVQQARFFVNEVQSHGLQAGDMLVADVEIFSGLRKSGVVKSAVGKVRSHLKVEKVPLTVVNNAAKTFLDEVQALVGHNNPVLLYTDLSVGSTLSSCTGYDLWIAYYSNSAPGSVSPWKNWRFWQYNGGPDQDGYNGSKAELDGWLGTFTAPPPGPKKLVADGTQTLTQMLQPSGTSPAACLKLTLQNGVDFTHEYSLKSIIDNSVSADTTLLVAGTEIYVW